VDFQDGAIVNRPWSTDEDPLFTEVSRAVLARDKEQTMQQDLADQLSEIIAWWEQVARADANRTIPKALEYGASDLDMMGTAMLGMAGHQWDAAPADERRQIGQEMAALFYLQGKVARAISALQQGRLASADTLFDITVYSMMLRRMRDFGSWV
jgi:hypothetical protein